MAALCNHVGNFKALLSIPIGRDKRLSGDAHRLIPSQVKHTGPDDRRTEHAHATIARNISYSFGGDDTSGIETVGANVERRIFQRQYLSEPFDTELRRGIRTA